MSHRPTRRVVLTLDVLEARIALSHSSAANVIGVAAGSVKRPHAVSRTSAQVAPRNITPGKHATLFGLFVTPRTGGLLKPKIVAARGSTGDALIVRHGRSTLTGHSRQTVAFAKDQTAGALVTEVTGRAGTVGSYQAETTLVGDINSDGKVDLADLQAFAPTYMSRKGQPNYVAAADFNRNGIINLYDAKALLHNIAPLTPRVPLTERLSLAPADQVHYSASNISGAATMHRTVTILGRTTPGSLVIEDNHTSRLPGGIQAYKFTGPAHATDANGFFSLTSTNVEGLNNNDFLILDPFGQQVIRSFPIFWIPYARGGSVPRTNR